MSTITKVVKKYGNSGGVYLPANWIGGRVRIELVKQPVDLNKDLFSLPLKHVVSMIIYGSYARGEMEEGSDIDIILVTDEEVKIEIPSEISKRYHVHVKSAEKIRKAVARDPVFYNVIKNESIAFINHKFLDELRQIKPIPEGLEFRLQMSESSIGIIKELIANKAAPIDLVYPIMLRLKEALFIECFMENKTYTTSLLKNEITSHGISSKDYQSIISAYRAMRDNKTPNQHKIPISVIEKLAMLLEKKIENVKQKKVQKGY